MEATMLSLDRICDHEPLSHAAADYAVVRRASMASFPADLSTFGPGIQKLAAEGRDLTAMDYFHAFESATNAANRSVNAPLQTACDFLLTPTLGEVALSFGALISM